MDARETHHPARALAALRRKDGTPDVQARRMALDNLTASLSNDEIRQLRTRFNAIQFRTDIFFKVPVEVALLIVEYLSFEDLMTARDVSLAWRHRCSSPDFEIKIIKLHFRTQWQQTDLEDTIAKQNLLYWFPKAAMKRIRKLSGDYISLSAYHYHRDGFLLPPLDKVEHQYNSGRIAYLFGHSIVVQDLNRGHLAQPKVYVEKNRITMRAGEWLLSNDLLVTYHRDLVAWSLASDDVHSVRLPGSTRHMAGRNKQVGIITFSNEIFVWNVGGSLISVEAPNTNITENGYFQFKLRNTQDSYAMKCDSGQLETQNHWSPEAIFFHPVQQGHFFVFYHDWPGKGILVQEFVDGKYHMAHFNYFGGEKYQIRSLDLRVVRVANDHELCSIGWDTLQRSTGLPSQVGTFNLLTLEFGTMPHPSPCLPRLLEDSARGMWSNPLEAMRHPSARVPEWAKDPTRGVWTQDERFEIQFSLLPSGVVELCPGTVYDDDFAILFGDYGYVVWCFDEDITLPLSGSLQDQSLERAPAARPLPLSRRLASHGTSIT